MPRITVYAANGPGEPRRWTLSERIVAENLDSDHYITQLVQRLAWATADAEAQESRANGTAQPAPARREPTRRRSSRSDPRAWRGRAVPID